MSKEKSVILSVQHRADPIEYRPHAHHLLHVADDTFDFKYSSFLWCESLLQEIRKRSFDFHASSKVKELSALIDSLPRNEPDMSILQVAHLQSALSDPDRSFIVQRIVSLLGSVKGIEKNLVFAHIHQHNLQSCHELLIEIATDLTKQPRVQSLLRRLPSQVSSVYTNDQLRQRNPLQFITHLMTLFSEELYIEEESDFIGVKEVIPTLIIVVPFFERLTSDVTADLIQTLQGHPWRTVLLLSSSDLTTVRLYHDHDLQSGISIQKYDLCSPLDLYNQIAAEVLPTNKLPVHFPSSVIRNLHLEFTSFTFCTSTFLKRLLSYVEMHFTQRKALLCMSSQWEWLQMMSIITKKANRVVASLVNDVPQNVAAENRESFIKAIAELLSYLDKSDIQDTKLQLSDSSDVKRAKEIESAYQSLTLYQDFRTLSRIVFNMLESLRDFLLPSHHQSKFCNSLLWAGVMDKSQGSRPCNFLREFQSMVSDQMVQVPVKTLVSAARDLSLLAKTKSLDQIQCGEMLIWLKRQLKAICEVNETLEMMKELFEDDSSPLNVSFQKMESLAVEADSSSSLGKKLSVEIIDSENPEQEEQRSSSTSVQLDTIDIIREMITDFRNWLVKFIADYAQLPTHSDGLSGVVYISSETEKQMQDLFNGNLRKRFMSGLLDPTPHLKPKTPSTESYIPDVCHFTEKVKYGQPMEIAHGWMDYFQGKITTSKWDLQNLPTKSKKRSRSKQGLESDLGIIDQSEQALEQNITKGRFVNALYDIERSGIISSKKIDRGDIVITKQIYTGI